MREQIAIKPAPERLGALAFATMFIPASLVRPVRSRAAKEPANPTEADMNAPATLIAITVPTEIPAWLSIKPAPTGLYRNRPATTA